VLALKGASGPREIVGKPTRSERYKIKLYVVGVDTAKDLVFSRLRQRVAGPGYMHLPHWVEEEYLEQLTAERAVRRWRKGRGWVREWQKTRERNEALDLEVYALAGVRILGSGLARIIGKRAEEFATPVEPQPGGEAKPTPEARPTRNRRRPGSWVNRWRKD
jgi:phage terminase large subunit GpA-like protein